MTQFTMTRKLLEQVLLGHSVGEALLVRARAELDRADPLLVLNLARQQHQAATQPPQLEETRLAARDAFAMLERFLVQARADNYFDSLDSLDADRILTIRSLLARAGQLPAATAAKAPLAFKRRPAT